jgi:mono/diheme cytochrome c family protein
MPAFKDKLSEAEIREVVRFVRIEIQKMAPQIVRKPTPQ